MKRVFSDSSGAKPFTSKNGMELFSCFYFTLIICALISFILLKSIGLGMFYRHISK